MESINIMVLIILFVFIVILRLTMKGQVNRKIFKYTNEKDYEGLYKVMDSFSCKMSYSAFDREFIRLQGYFNQKISKKIDQQIDFMMNGMRLNDDQKMALARQGFYYYLKKEDYPECEKILNFAKNTEGKETIVDTMEMMYSIIALKESKYIERIEKRLYALSTDGSSDNIGLLEYLLGLQYSYLKDDVNTKKYLSSALEHCKGSLFEKEIERLYKEKL